MVLVFFGEYNKQSNRKIAVKIVNAENIIEWNVIPVERRKEKSVGGRW